MILFVLVRPQTWRQKAEVNQWLHDLEAVLGSALLTVVCHVKLDHTFLDLVLHLVLSRVRRLDLRDDKGSILE